METPRVLILDDEPSVGRLIGTVAERVGLPPLCCSKVEEFMASYERLAPDVIVLDLMMPEVDGVEVLRLLAEKGCEAQILLVSGFDSRVLQTAERLGAARGLKMLGSLQKPLRIAELELKFRQALEVDPVIAGTTAAPQTQPLTEDDLRRALAEDELTVYHQPCASRRAQGVWIIDSTEALVRWQHPQHGLLPPLQFIPLAEETGLVSELTEYVVRRAAQQLRRWHQEGLDLSTSVNIAPQLLMDLGLPDRLAAIVGQSRLEPTSVTLEITESAAMTDPSAAMEILSRFRLKGFGLSMDDFGTGYSSLRELYRMPFSELKIDRTFVTEVGASEEARAIVRSIVSLAHNLGMGVCAEGVETQEALEFLDARRCERVQGFFIARPAPPSDLVDAIRRWQGEEPAG